MVDSQIVAVPKQAIQNVAQSTKQVAQWGFEVEKGKIKAPMIIAFVLVIAVIAFIVLRKYFKDTIANAPKSIGYLDEATHGQVTKEWLNSRLEGYVETLFAQLTTNYYTGFQAGERCGIFEQCVKELNDNQLIAVCNTFVKRKNKTIRALMGASTWSGCGVLGTDYHDLLLKRLNNLSIP